MSITNKPIRDELNTKGKYISPFVSNGNNFRSANKTNLDITNPNPSGGPINDPASGYTHTYTPNNTYLDNFQEAASNNSAFGTIGDEVQNGSIFEQTGLDVENSLPLGGPNRTNISNIPGGQYTPLKSSDKFGETLFPGGPLKTKENKNYKVLVQQWNSKNTYLNSLTPENGNI